MRMLAIATGGFLVGAALILGVALALPQHTNITVKTTSPQTAMPMSHVMGGGGMVSQTSNPMTSAVTAAAPGKLVKLTIQHVQRGCHVWSSGTTTGTMMRLHLRPGQKLSILDADVDAHQMMQFAGPAQMHLGGR
jgi:hypothetical protein